MNAEENIFATTPGDKIVLKAITPAHVKNPSCSWMSIRCKKVLDELVAKKKSGALKVTSLLEKTPTEKLMSALVILNTGRRGHQRRF
jgi:hypothetical protein